MSDNEYKEVVCRISSLQKNPCKITECKHHQRHVPCSQDGWWYKEKNLPKLNQCPYGVSYRESK